MKGSVWQGEEDAGKQSYRTKQRYTQECIKMEIDRQCCSLSPLRAEGLDSNSMGQQERKAIQN